MKLHKRINNVLITGGDPLVLKNEVIEKFLSILSDFPQLKFIRFGSRAPVTFPSRFEDEIYFKYHQAKNKKRLGKIFTRPVDENAGWLDDFTATSVRVLDVAPYLV